MPQTALFYESLDDAIKDVIRVCGGAKVVGSKLWPEKSPEAASRLLNDCLNEHRPERLSPAQLMLIARMGRDKGCHAVMYFMCADLSYSQPVPIEPEDELAGLLREYLASRKAGDRMESKIDDKIAKLRSVA